MLPRIELLDLWKIGYVMGLFGIHGQVYDRSSNFYRLLHLDSSSFLVRCTDEREGNQSRNVFLVRNRVCVFQSKISVIGGIGLFWILRERFVVDQFGKLFQWIYCVVINLIRNKNKFWACYIIFNQWYFKFIFHQEISLLIFSLQLLFHSSIQFPSNITNISKNKSTNPDPFLFKNPVGTLHLQKDSHPISFANQISSLLPISGFLREMSRRCAISD